MHSRVSYYLTFPGLLILLLSQPRFAIAQIAPQPALPLMITVPNGAKIDTEFNGDDSDLLGMVKDLITGMNGSEPTKAGTPAPPKPGSSPLDMILGSDANGSLSSLLKNVKHLHLVIYSIPATFGSDSSLKDVKEDTLGFYERSFQTEGGRRLLYINGKDKVLITGFDQPRGVAVVVGQGDKITIARSVGYPDMKVVGSLVRRFTGIGMDESAAAIAASASATASPAPKKAPVKPTKKRKTTH